MKTLIIHHLQPMWNQGLIGFGTSFDEELMKVLDHLDSEYYDKVIVTNFEGTTELEEEQLPILDYTYPQVEDYGYGWDYDSVDFTERQIQSIEAGGLVVCEYGNHWVQGGNHSTIVYVPEWMMELQGEVYICGAFDGECIEDLEIALTGAGKEFNRINELIT